MVFAIEIAKARKGNFGLQLKGSNFLTITFGFGFEFQKQHFFCYLGKGGYASTYIDLGLGFSNYCKLRLTGGIAITDHDQHEEIKKIEQSSCVDYERFRKG